MCAAPRPPGEIERQGCRLLVLTRMIDWFPGANPCQFPHLSRLRIRTEPSDGGGLGWMVAVVVTELVLFLSLGVGAASEIFVEPAGPTELGPARSRVGWGTRGWSLVVFEGSFLVLHLSRSVPGDVLGLSTGLQVQLLESCVIINMSRALQSRHPADDLGVSDLLTEIFQFLLGQHPRAVIKQVSVLLVSLQPLFDRAHI